MGICTKKSARGRSVINTKSAVGRYNMESAKGMSNKTYAKGNCVNNNTVRWILTANKGDHALEMESTKVENNQMGDKVGDKYTVSKDRVEVQNTVHINIQEGGHALKSLLPGVQGGALHGAHDGGEASQTKLTSCEVPPSGGGDPSAHDVWGGHAQIGARPGEGRDQGVEYCLLLEVQNLAIESRSPH